VLNRGDFEWVKSYLVPSGFKRIQLNSTKVNGVEIPDFKVALKNLRAVVAEVQEVEWIVQANTETRELWEGLLNDSHPPHNLSMLFDASCGTGVLTTTFMPPPRNGIPCGYAGGLGPDTILGVLQSLRRGVGNGRVIWIDMETRLRSNVDGKDMFDISKAQTVCKVVDNEGWEQALQPELDATPPPPPPPNAKVSGHPLLAHKMTLLRDRTSPPRDFRQLLREITFHLGYEATSTLLTAFRSDVVTPVGTATGDKAVRLSESVALVPVLRAGLGMVDAMLELLPNAVVHHLGMFRTHGANSRPIEYYSRLPKDSVADLAFILEPMIATSRTAHAAIAKLKGWGCQKIVVLTVCASHPGLCELQKTHPDVSIFAAQVDHTLREDGYIVPGLGDAGDRQFGTPEGNPMSRGVYESPLVGKKMSSPGLNPRSPKSPNKKIASPENAPVTRVLGEFATYGDPDTIPEVELTEASATPLTTHDGAYGPEPVLMNWGAANPEQRGPVLATSRHMNQRNAIGAHSGGYSIYRALAVVSSNLDDNYMPKLGMTTPVARIGPFPSWHDPKRIVTIDPYGHAISEGFGPWLDRGYDIRPTIAVT
jgi:uracil phosphoribosyltransferase